MLFELKLKRVPQIVTLYKNFTRKEGGKRMKAMTKLTIFIITVSLFACGGNHSNPFSGKSAQQAEKIFNDNKNDIQNDEKLSSEQRSQKMVELGKAALEAPLAAGRAIQAFEEALRLNDKNIKAHFYVALLKPIDVLRGLLPRMSLILGEEAMKEIALNRAKVALGQKRETKEEKAIYDFFMDSDVSKEKFKNPSALQTFFLKEFSPLVLEAQKKMDWIIEQDPSFQIEFDYSQWKEGFSFKDKKVALNSVELKSAKLALKGIETIAKFLVAYNLNAGLMLRDHFRHVKSTNAKEVIAYIKRYPRFLTLNPGGEELLKSILKDASESIEGLSIVANLLYHSKDRIGFAIPTFGKEKEYTDLMEGLKTASKILAGPVARVLNDFAAQWHYCPNCWVPPYDRATHDKHEEEVLKSTFKTEEEYTVIVDWTALLAKPVKDLKDLLPTEFSQEGERIKAKSFPDHTFGGMVPNKDLVIKLCRIWHAMEPDHQEEGSKQSEAFDCSEILDGK